jgi:DNA-binding NarL/FixJ family response regulator
MARKSNDKWTDEEDKRLFALRAAGKSNVMIAAALRRTESSVVGRIYVLRKRATNGKQMAGLSSRLKPGWSAADEARLIELISAGASVSEMANDLKRTEAAIENRIHVVKYRTRA